MQRGDSINHGVELLGPPFRDPDNALILTVQCFVVDCGTVVALCRLRTVKRDQAILAVHDIRLW